MLVETAISIRELSKCYQIYNKPHDRLRQAIIPRLFKPVALIRRFFIPSAAPFMRRYYKEFWALREASFEVMKGETVGIIGRNGSGKSTLLQMICGTLTPSGGDIAIDGRVAALLELGAGFNPEFTGRENVYMNATILGLSRAEIDARYDDIVSFADIGEFIEQPVKTYSSGMYVRLAFAVIAHVDADILIIDEALAVGDAFFTQKCMRFLRKFKETGTVLFVSHDSGAVVNLCQRAIWLEQGRMKMIGDAKQVCEAYQESVYESQQGPLAISSASVKATRVPAAEKKPPPAEGARPENSGPLILEQFEFDPDGPSFGAGGAMITDVGLLDAFGQSLNRLVEGGETVIVAVHCRAERDIDNPIVGFFIKDRLGQTLFGDNTYLSYLGKGEKIHGGQILEARFEFAMPLLPAGDYSICAAIAEGTQHDHVQHHWMHDALIFRVNVSAIHCGLVGIPMHSISLRIAPAA